MQLSRSIQIIGWGDTPTEDRFSVDNSTVLRMIERNLEPLAFSSQLPSEERDKYRTELEKIRAHTAESVTEKFGIVTRQYIPNTNSTELARQAAERAIAVATRNDPNFSREKIHLVISGGSSPDDLYPSCAAKLQHQLGIPDAEAFDVSAACCSGTQALIEAIRALQIGCDLYVLIALGETVGSRCDDHMDENALLWGDGGGAIVVRVDMAGNKKFGVQNFVSRTDGSLSGTTRSRGIGTHPDHRRFPALNASMEGRGSDLYRWVIGPVAKKLKKFLEDSRITVDERTFLVPHNGNLRMVCRVGEVIGVPSEQVINRIAERGNQSSVSVISTLAHYAEQDFFKRGDQLIMVTFGGGAIYNFTIYRWP